MSTLQFLIQIIVTFAAAFLGASLTRWIEKFKHLQELRSAAYADFVRGVATAAEQSHSDNTGKGGMALVADSRARIAIYGGKNVVRSLAKFIAFGAQTCNREGMQAFAELCRMMRVETGREQVAEEDINRLLFS